jgi:hypothetical protein
LEERHIRDEETETEENIQRGRDREERRRGRDREERRRVRDRG